MVKVFISCHDWNSKGPAITCHSTSPGRESREWPPPHSHSSPAIIRPSTPWLFGIFSGSGSAPRPGPGGAARRAGLDAPCGRPILSAPPVGARRVRHHGGYSLILSPLTNMAAWISNSEELVSWKTEICIVWPFQTKNYMYAGHSDMQRMKGQGTSGWFTWFIQWKSISFDSYWSGDCRGSSCLFCVYQ